MFKVSDYSDCTGAEFWKKVTTDLDLLLSPNDHQITILANATAFLAQTLQDINWCGFYLFDGNKLFLGPFWGKPACTEIHLGKGVCGTAAIRKEIVVVDNVETFPGHIVCDGDSRSEIVLPLLHHNAELFGVLDIDSPLLSRFDPSDIQGLDEVRDLLMRKILASNNTLFPQR